MTILGNGNVGIGITTPTAMLEVNGDGKFAKGIVANAGGTSTDGLTVGSPTGNGSSVNLLGSGGANWSMSNASGNLAFKSATGGSTTATFAANGDATFAGRTTIGGQLQLTGSGVTGGSSGLVLSAGGTNQNITLTPSGSGVIVAAADIRRGGLNLSPNGLNATAGDLVLSADGSSQNIVLRTAGAERARVTATGNLGLGVLAPTTRLGVAGHALLSPVNATAAWAGWPTVYTINDPATSTYSANVYVQNNKAHSRVELLTAVNPTLGNNRAVFSGTVTGGDLGSPQATPAGASLNLRFATYDGTTASTGYNEAASIQFMATAAHSAGSRPTAISLATTNTGEASPSSRVYIAPNGNVGIGTLSTANAKLSVDGLLRAREVVVNADTWADDVFAEGRRLAPLSEVESHIKAEKHLPGIPSAQEVAATGVNVGEMQVKLLSKVEELTLHLIAQEKFMKQQAELMKTQQQQLSQQNERIERLESENQHLRQQTQ